MFSSIFSIAIDPITITDEESVSTAASECPEQVSRTIFNTICEDLPSKSLLSVLDDKNRLISCLTKQLQNQKMQLTYYIKRELSRKKIQQLSESCTPQASEESLPLTLAINKFCRQAGIKTKLLMVHERMKRLDYKISNSLKDQEFVLRKIVNRLCDFLKVQEVSRANIKDQFGSFITDPLHVNLFDKLLTATLSLRRKLDSFKICCDRVLIIEEERNAIVEQVYSLPVEDRINCNYLLDIQMEKAQLENEIKRISQHQATGRHRIKELNVIEKILHNLQWELNRSFLKNEESCISQMLKKINSEAQVLLEMTKDQKRRFEGELSKTKCPEPNRVLLFINIASGGDKFEKRDFDRLGIKTEEDIRFFEMVKEEVDALKKKMMEEAEKNIKRVKTEYDLLRGKLTQVLLDNSQAKVANKSLHEELAELKLEQKNGIQRLKQERDAYKSQVEDLQVIREAYAQLVEKQPNASQMERECLQQIDERDNYILELEKLAEAQCEEIKSLKVKLTDQNDQIDVLNRFIHLTRPNSPKAEQRIDNENLSLHPCCSKTVSLSKRRIDKLSQSDACCYNANQATKKDSKLRKSDHIILPRYPCCGLGTKKINKGLIKKNTLHKQKMSLPPCNYSTEIQNLLSTSFETLSQSDHESLNCINIISQKNIKSGDMVQTVVTTSEEVKGKVKKEKSSILSVEIKYKNSDINNPLLNLKDISKESVMMENR